MSAATAARLPAQDLGHRPDVVPGSGQGCWLLAGRPLEAFPRLATLLAADDPAEPDGPPSPAPSPDRPSPGSRPVREVLKAGRWDRSVGDGSGFAAGGAADRLPPGAVLARLAGDLWEAGLGRLSDDELIGVLRAARRMGSWAAGMELAAVGDLWRRRLDEEQAGDRGVAEHADGELAAALTLTGRAAGDLLELAIAVQRLPLTAAALAAGDLDLPRVRVIVNELAGLADEHAAAVEQAIIGSAVGKTTGQLRQAVRRAVIAADPAAARKRKEQALGEARVERWTEHEGTAALAGRDLPPLSVLAADHNLTALAQQLKDAGCEGTMDTLRASVYLALLAGTPISALLPTNPAGSAGCPGSGDRAGSGGRADLAGSGGPGKPSRPGGPAGGGTGAGGCPEDTSAPDGPATRPPIPGGPEVPAGLAIPPLGHPSTLAVKGSVNLTLPLATWLGLSGDPGHTSGHGFLDATDSRALANALAARRGTTWCLTLTGPDGRPVAHGCARTGPPPRPHRPRPGTGPPAPAGPAPTRAPPTSPGAGPDAAPWTFKLTWLGCGECDHAHQTAAYRPGRALRHLVHIRQPACTFPGCRRPAMQCDDDHTIPFHLGGRSCLCNLSPLCRKHHKTKQAHGWTLQQTIPGTMTWITPAGRRYTTDPAAYH